MTQDEALEKLVQQNGQILKALGGGGGRGSYGGESARPSGGSGGSGIGGAIDAGLGAAKNVTNGLDALWRGSVTVSSGFDGLNKAIASSGGKLGAAFASISSTLGGAVLDTNNALNQSLKNGANFDNNLAEYDRLIKGARMTHEEYNEIIKKGAEEMRGLGSNINVSQKNFLSMAKALQEGEIGTKLKEIGLHAEDLNAVLAGTMANRRGMDMSDMSTKKAAIESAERLAVAMEETARISGESRQQQIDEMKQRSADARMKVQFMSMDKQAQERYTEGMQKMAQLGPSAEKLFRDTFFGKITKEGSTAIAALGTSAADIQKAALSAKDQNASQADRAKLADTAIKSNLDWKLTTGAQNFAKYSEGAAADALVSDYDKDKLLQPVMAKMDEVKNQTGQTIDAGTALTQLKDVVHKGVNQQNPDGTKMESDGATVAKAINAADRKLADLTAGSTAAFGALNTELATTIKGIGDLNKVLAPLTQEQANPAAMYTEFMSPKNLPTALTDARKDQTHELTTPAQMAAPVQPAVKRATGSPSFENFLNGSGGFKDMFESFNTSGTPAELHGNELVATESQMKRFVQQLLPPPPIASQKVSDTPVMPSLPPIDLKNTPTTPIQQLTTPVDAVAVATDKANKVLAESLNIVSDRLKELTAVLHDFKPLEHINHVVEKVTAAQKPVQPPVQEPTPPAEPKKESASEIAKNAFANQITADNAALAKKEEKPAEVKKEEPKLLNLGIKTAEDLNKFLFGGVTLPKIPSKEDKDKLMEQGKTAESFFKGNAEKVSDQMREQFNKMAPNPFDKLPVPEIKESQIVDAPSKNQLLDKQFKELSKTVSNSLITNRVEKHDESKKIQPVDQKSKMPDVSSLDSSLVNIAKFNKAMQSGDISKIGMAQMDLSDAGKAAEKKLGPSTASIALQKKREALENASFDYEEMKAAKTKPTAESAERLAKKKEEVAKLSLAYEEDLIKTKGRLNLHATEEIKHAEVKNKNNETEKAQQVTKALADEKKFMKEHGPGSDDKATAQLKTDADKTVDKFNATNFKFLDEDAESIRKKQAEQAKEKDKSPGIFDSISNFFTTTNKPAFASGNVKYEEIPQAEIDAKNKRMQESIGKVDNSPEAIAAQKAELDRQKNSGMYKQKEPEKPKIEEVKKPAETKEDAHVKDMYKKYGLETFKDYNARVSAEVKQSHAQIKNVAANKPGLTPTDVASKPAPVPKPVEPQQPAPAAQPQAQVIEKQVTLKDIHDDLMQLNKAIAEMVHHTDQISNNSHKQVSVTKQLSNSRW